jgi:hypothetical protein
VAVAQHLDFDVARLFDVFLDEDRSSPKEERASLVARSKPSAHSASFQAMRIPLPPPPALALIITG